MSQCGRGLTDDDPRRISQLDMLQDTRVQLADASKDAVWRFESRSR